MHLLLWDKTGLSCTLCLGLHPSCSQTSLKSFWQERPHHTPQSHPHVPPPLPTLKVQKNPSQMLCFAAVQAKAKADSQRKCPGSVQKLQCRRQLCSVLAVLSWDRVMGLSPHYRNLLSPALFSAIELAAVQTVLQPACGSTTARLCILCFRTAGCFGHGTQ